MNIIHLTPYYAPAYSFGGVVSAVEGLARAQARRGHTVTVVATDVIDRTTRYSGAADEQRDDVRVVRVPNRWLWPRARYNLSTPIGLAKAAQDVLAEADVLHLHEFRTLENLQVVPHADRVPIVLSPHGTLSHTTGRGRIKRGWDRFFSPRIARHIDVIVGLTEAEVDEARALWEMTSWHKPAFAVVPNGVDPAEFDDLPGGAAFRAEWNLGDGPVCLFLGRVHPRKGVHLLVDAFDDIDYPAARLVLAGPDEGGLSGMRDHFDGRVVVTGYLDRDARMAALAAADLLALPAVGEGLPMAVLEAMAAGLPVIISPGCHLPQVATVGAGLIVSPAVVPLVDALHTLLYDPDRRERMGESGRSLVESRYTWDRIAEQYEAVYPR